jgi:hypothetical protein
MVEARAGAESAAADPRIRMTRALLALAAATMLTPAAPAQKANRPDLGIGADDASLKAHTHTVIVRNLGSAATPGGTLFLEGSSGRTATSTKIAALAAPTDLTPKTVRVRFTVPAGVAVEARWRRALADESRGVAMRDDLPLATRR